MLKSISSHWCISALFATWMDSSGQRNVQEHEDKPKEQEKQQGQAKPAERQEQPQAKGEQGQQGQRPQKDTPEAQPQQAKEQRPDNSAKTTHATGERAAGSTTSTAAATGPLRKTATAANQRAATKKVTGQIFTTSPAHPAGNGNATCPTSTSAQCKKQRPDSGRSFPCQFWAASTRSVLGNPALWSAAIRASSMAAFGSDLLSRGR